MVFISKTRGKATCTHWEKTQERCYLVLEAATIPGPVLGRLVETGQADIIHADRRHVRESRDQKYDYLDFYLTKDSVLVFLKCSKLNMMLTCY